MTQSFIRLIDVSFSYPGGHRILEGVNLDIAERELVVIRGESGAGKSTFLKLINRFCDSAEGRILYHGRELREYRIEEIRKSVIYLPQLPVVIDGTVEENFAFPFSFHAHRGKTYSPGRAKEWLDYFQMDVPLNRDALKLSVGQKQRIALIRAMLLGPEVLLLDEPGSALDAGNKQLIEQKIESLTGAPGITVLMVTHSSVSFSEGGYREYNLESGSLCKAG